MWHGRILRTQNCGTRYRCLAVAICDLERESRKRPGVAALVDWGAAAEGLGKEKALLIVVVEWSPPD